ncbi:hypothetical protein V8E52_000820 [Russula decolorans]
MVNYHDPDVVLQDTLAVSNIWHVVAGLYFWEFVTTFDYEWSVIRRHRPYRWSIWIYSTTRIATVIGLILAIYGLDVSTPYNCHDPKVETILQLFFGYLAIAAASLLIVLRILAIWNRKKIIVAIAAGILGINVIFLIQGIVRIRTVWDPMMSTCLVVNLHISELNILVTLATDIILLFIMSFGLFRQGFHERSASGLGRFLWKQGLIWLLAATIAEALPATMPPSGVLNTPTAHCGRYSRVGDPIGLQGSGHIEWTGNTAPIKLAPPSRKKVAINRTYEQDQTLQTSQYGSPISVEGQSCEKAYQATRV